MKRKSVFYTCLLALSLCAQSLYSATLYVSTSGSNSNSGTEASPYGTIQHAINQAAAGDTIIVASGTYNEALSIDVSNLTIKSESSGIARITQSAFSGTGQVIHYGTSVDGGRLERLEIEGGSNYAIKFESNWSSASSPKENNVQATKNVHVVECIIHDTGRDGFKITPGSDGHVIFRCEIYNTGVRDPSNCDGVDMVNADDIIVADCYIHNSNTRGAYCKGGAKRTLFEGNFVENCEGGLYTGFFADAEWMDDGNTDQVESFDAVIRNNVIVNCSAPSSNHAGGIETLASHRARVYNNTLVNNGGAAFIVGKSNDGYAFCDDVIFYNNLVSNGSGYGNVMVKYQSGAGITGNGSAQNIVFDNNLYYHSSSSLIFQGASGTWTANSWQSSGQDGNSIFGQDPLLDSNYHLSSETSPAVGAGRDLGDAVSLDIDGESRSGSNDIGADQYSLAATLILPPPDGTPGTGSTRESVSGVPSSGIGGGGSGGGGSGGGDTGDITNPLGAGSNSLFGGFTRDGGGGGGCFLH